MRLALKSRAPCITLRPTPPHPKTATVMPTLAAGMLITEPTPVVTQQPMSAATCMGTPSGMGWQACWGATRDSPKTPSLLIWPMSVSPSWSLAVPSYCRGPVKMLVSQSWGLPVLHWWQWPQLETNERMQRSPGFTRVTPSPTSATVPAPSWPRTMGTGWMAVPFMTW